MKKKLADVFGQEARVVVFLFAFYNTQIDVISKILSMCFCPLI